MFGFGLGEVLLIGLMLVVGLSALVGFDFLKKGVKEGQTHDFERRILDELEVLRLRMDAINDRLDSLDSLPSMKKSLTAPEGEKEPR